MAAYFLYLALSYQQHKHETFIEKRNSFKLIKGAQRAGQFIGLIYFRCINLLLYKQNKQKIRPNFYPNVLFN